VAKASTSDARLGLEGYARELVVGGGGGGRWSDLPAVRAGIRALVRGECSEVRASMFPQCSLNDT
jgi:hypothetical protein